MTAKMCERCGESPAMWRVNVKQVCNGCKVKMNDEGAERARKGPYTE